MKLKNALMESSNNTLPQLMFLLNQLNEMYYLFEEKSKPIRSLILNKVTSDLKTSLEIMLSQIQKDYPQFKLEGGPNGYNVRKK